LFHGDQVVQKRLSGKLSIWFGLGLAVAGAVAIAVWQFTPCEFKGTASAEESSDIPISFEEFRTIMVRNSPTRTIIDHGGMQLATEEVLDLKLDLSHDRRPLLNAILRQSQSEVASRKRIVVKVNSEEVHAKNLELMQDAEITPQAMDVSTVSRGPAGELSAYRTTLHAEPNGSATTVRVKTEIKIEKQLSKLFHGTAKSRLEASTKDAVQEQLAALQQFTTDNAKK